MDPKISFRALAAIALFPGFSFADINVLRVVLICMEFDRKVPPGNAFFFFFFFLS